MTVLKMLSYTYIENKLAVSCQFLKVCFFQKVMAKFSNLSNRHACEPKIVPELLFPVNVFNTIWTICSIHLAKKSASYKL